MIFWNRKTKCPVTESDQKFVEETYSWIFDKFGKTILEKNVILPKWESFGFQFSRTKKDVFLILDYACKRMEVDPKNIQIKFYNERKQVELGEGLTTKYDEETELTTGKYIQYTTGDVEILIEEEQVLDSVSLIATIVHELVHYKLLYEENLDEDDEFITDLMTVAYGFGIFGANTSVVKMQSWSDGAASGWQIKGGSGYLHSKVWSYALAYHCLLKNDFSPKWSKYLEKDILKPFNKCLKYLKERDK